MRIGATYSQSSSATEANTSAAARHGHRPEGSSSDAPSSASGVKVTWSAKALALDEAQTSESSDKVQRLRSAVESGQLSVDPDKIAAAIVGE